MQLEVVVRERLQLREGWSSLLLLLFIMLTMAWTFEAGGLAEGLSVLARVVVLGTLTGLVLAKVRLPGFLAHVVGLGLGILFSFLLLRALIELPPQVHAQGWLAVEQAKVEVLFTRLELWLGAAVHGESSSDPLPFVAQMTCLSWLISFYGAWVVFHSHWVWGAVLPPGIAIFLGVYYAPPGLLAFFVVYLLWALILVVRVNVYQKQCEWESHGAAYEPYIGLDFLRDGALIALAVVCMAWLLPHPRPAMQVGDAARALEGPWRAVQDQWTRLYASLSYPDQPGTSAFGRTLTLTGGISLGTAAVLQVQAPEEHYWRAVVLDRYTGKGWVDTSPARVRLDSGEPLAESDLYQARAVMTQTVTCLRPGEPLLYAAGEPLRVLLRTDAQALLTPSGGHEVSCIAPAQRLGRGQRYTAESLVSTASVSRLRQAETVYPAWIAERYLQIPDSLPKRVLDLARELAGNEPTAYDQATAIEAYLRQIEYNQAIDAPPAGVDPVDWFLFDNREGYCTYYASAMVLMCRAVGLPARLAQGYTAGQYTGETGTYVVREADAHAWPEVYFPGYGWIEFEPTASLPLLIRPAEEVAGEGESLGPAGAGTNRRRNQPGLDNLPDDFAPDSGVEVAPGPLARRVPWTRIALGALAAAAVLAVAWRYGRRWWTLRPAERLYVRLAWLARPLGVPANPCQTPAEFGVALDEALGAERPLAGEIVQLYTRERFARRRPAPYEIAAGERAWRRLSLLALRRALDRLLGRGRTPAGEASAQV